MIVSEFVLVNWELQNMYMLSGFPAGRGIMGTQKMRKGDIPYHDRECTLFF